MDEQVKKEINMQNNNGKKFFNILSNFIKDKKKKVKKEFLDKLREIKKRANEKEEDKKEENQKINLKKRKGKKENENKINEENKNEIKEEKVDEKNENEIKDDKNNKTDEVNEFDNNEIKFHFATFLLFISGYQNINMFFGGVFENNLKEKVEQTKKVNVKNISELIKNNNELFKKRNIEIGINYRNIVISSGITNKKLTLFYNTDEDLTLVPNTKEYNNDLKKLENQLFPSKKQLKKMEEEKAKQEKAKKEKENENENKKKELLKQNFVKDLNCYGVNVKIPVEKIVNEINGMKKYADELVNRILVNRINDYLKSILKILVLNFQ